MSYSLSEDALQEVYDKLVGDMRTSGINIYTYVPGMPEGKPDSDFPYIVLGLDGMRPWDTDDKVGKVLDIYCHIWSRYKGAKETREIIDQIYSSLHRATFPSPPFHLVDCIEAFSQVYQDPDGKTMHGISRYRLTIQEE